MGKGDILKQLRSLMASSKYFATPLNAYIVPSSDEHGSEYLAECDERRAFVSGFTGSAGTAVITQHAALLWTDSRYHLQAEQQLGPQWTLMKEGLSGVDSQAEWLSSRLDSGSVVGVDPRLMSGRSWSSLASDLDTAGIGLRAVSVNLIDLLWSDRPARPANPVFHHPLEFSGASVCEKLRSTRKLMESKKCTLLVLSALDEIAYLLNLRGADIDYNPVFFAYCVLDMQEVHLFINADQLNNSVRASLLDEAAETVHFHDYDQVWPFCQQKASTLEGKLWICPLASYALTSIFSEKQRFIDRTPPCKMKAIKNNTEIEGMKKAHVRDAAALCTFLCWLQEQVQSGADVTELSAADKLQQLRSEQQHFMGLSFPTISSFGANAAIIHYSPSKSTDTSITCDNIYLVDSGGQYRDGTTDVTRTLHFGHASSHQKMCYTRVLKGHIALATAVFPENTRGSLLDPLARLSLWRVGLDYGHGTGHGVGSFLNVHEGPMSIHCRPQPASEPGLQAGMFVSNEPGYYEAGEFGVRLENIVQVVPTETSHNFCGKQFLTFNNATLVPFQSSLLVPELLTQTEVEWLNSYHMQCREQVGVVLKQQNSQAAYSWLVKQTEPIG